MKYDNMDISSLRNELDNNHLTALELFNLSHNKAEKYQDKYNSFVTILNEFSIKNTSSMLCNIPYSLKDNISTSNILTTASSNILKNYIPVFDATVYKKLQESGAILIGKTTLDELAMGGTGTTANTGLVRNPWNHNRLIGGSSAGSTASVALGITPFSIASDTGDSIRKPASYGGIVGFKPTYGRVSRYGLFAFASSLDHVGCLTRNVRDAAIVIDNIKGYDHHDMTSLEDDNIKYTDYLEESIKSKKLFYFKNICDKSYYNNLSKTQIECLNNFHDTINKCRKNGFIVNEIDFDIKLLKAIYPSYMCISCAEATSNNSNLMGIHFGNRLDENSIKDLIFANRTKGFSELIKRRFILGSYILQKENQEKLFKNACRVRRLIVNKMNELFNNYDGLIMPSSGDIAPLFNNSSDKLSDEYLILENHLAIANFGGFPSISIPNGFVDNMPTGISITCKAKEDAKTLNIAYQIEKLYNYKNQIAKEK